MGVTDKLPVDMPVGRFTGNTHLALCRGEVRFPDAKVQLTTDLVIVRLDAAADTKGQTIEREICQMGRERFRGWLSAAIPAKTYHADGVTWTFLDGRIRILIPRSWHHGVTRVFWVDEQSIADFKALL